MKKIDLIVDLQYGSTGKGLLAGWLGATQHYDVVINANMPNAGHTYIDEKDQKMIHKVLPSGLVSPRCKWVLLGGGSIFSIERLVDELEQLDRYGYNGFKVVIHPNAAILQSRHANLEKGMDSIGSTKQGAGEAMIEKIRRNVDGSPFLTAYNYQEQIMNDTGGKAIVATHPLWRSIIDGADNILAEGAQGYSLGINQSFYPFTTSRECTPARFMSDMGLPLGMLRKVYGTARVHPIRVGGNSGGCYDDQTEIDWTDLGVKPELTTVTQKERRVFTFSYQQINDAIWEAQPTNIFLNFVNYDGDEANKIIRHYGELISHIGTGPNHSDVIPRKCLSVGGSGFIHRGAMDK